MLRFNPRIKLGPVTFGKRGVSVRTGIPGLTAHSSYSDLARRTDEVNDNSDTDQDEESSELSYSVGKAIVVVLFFLFLLWSLSTLFGLMFSPQWYFLTPIPFLYNPLTMLFRQYVYGTKQVPIRKSDRRHKVGYRIDGWRTVEDRDNKIPYSVNAVIVRRVAGGIKLLAVLAALIHAYPVYQATAQKNRAKEIADSVAAVKAATPKAKHTSHHKKKHHRKPKYHQE